MTDAPPRGLAGRVANYGDRDFALYLRRSFAKSMGYSQAMLERPVVGILDTGSGFNNCHRTMPELIEAVRRGVLAAGGLPLPFPTVSLCEPSLFPTSMHYRNLAAIDAEAMLTAQPMDAAVLVGGCDKTVPAQLMAAASADIPVVQLVTGPMLAAPFQGERLSACTDCRRYWAAYRAGRVSGGAHRRDRGAARRDRRHLRRDGHGEHDGLPRRDAGLHARGRRRDPRRARRPAARRRGGGDAGDAADRGAGAALGAGHAAFGRERAAGAAGTRRLDQRADPPDRDRRPARHPRRSRPAQRALRRDPRAGGPEAHRRGLHGGFSCRRRDAGAAVGAARPAASATRRMLPGTILGERLAEPAFVDRRFIRARAEPVSPVGGIVALFGSLAPRGAILKRSAATPALFETEARAVVFDGLDDLAARIDDPALDVSPADALVLKNAGPLTPAGMPEAGYLPIPRKLASAGVKDMLRISDCRMSGTAFGTIVLHATPEAAAGGPLALAETGDRIRLSVRERRLDLLVDDATLARRREALAAAAETRARLGPDRCRSGDAGRRGLRLRRAAWRLSRSTSSAPPAAPARHCAGRWRRPDIPFVPVVRDAARWAAVGLAGAARIADLADPPALATALGDARRVASGAHARHAAAILAAAPNAHRFVLLGSTRKFTAWPDEHARGVLAGEAAFLAAGRPGVMLHPTMIYGAAGRGQRAAPRRPAAAPAGWCRLPRGGAALVQPIHQDDVTRCLMAALARDWAGPQAMVIAGPEPVSYAGFVGRGGARRRAGAAAHRAVAAAAAARGRGARAGAAVGLPRVQPAELRRLLEDKAFDIGPMRRELGVAPIGLAEGLARTFAAQNGSGAPSRRIASASGV